MRQPRSHRAAILCAALLGASWSVPARADLFLPLDDGAVAVEAHRATLARSGPAETLIFELDVRSTARRFVWLRPYPVEPKRFTPVEQPFDVLKSASVVHSPYNQLIRKDLFGPSVVTVLVDRLFRDAPPPVEDTLPEGEERSLAVGPFTYFSGQVTTSTKSYELFLPDTLATYLEVNGATVDQRQIADLAIPLNRGWILAAAIVEDAAPAQDRPARLGPIGVAFRSPYATYPVVGQGSAVGGVLPFEFFLVSTEPLVSSAHETIWDVRPWEDMDVPDGKFHVDYNDPIVPDSPVAIELTERQELPLQEGARLLHSRFESPPSRIDTLTFVPARDPVTIPSGTRRGSGFDIFLCMLLGLTPLLYTPESWFLLWIVSRARARARRGGSAFGTKLWSFYAVIVGLYWFVVLPDAARIAGVVPLLVGIGQLAWPYTEREAPRVRVQFPAKKKARG